MMGCQSCHDKHSSLTFLPNLRAVRPVPEAKVPLLGPWWVCSQRHESTGNPLHNGRLQESKSPKQRQMKIKGDLRESGGHDRQ